MLSNDVPEEWLGVFDLASIDGMPKVEETVFFHRPSRSLIVADLLFNILEPKGFGIKIATRLFGTYRRLGISRFYKLGIKDRTAFAESVRSVISRDFDRLIPAHGAIVETDAKEKTKAVLSEFL